MFGKSMISAKRPLEQSFSPRKARIRDSTFTIPQRADLRVAELDANAMLPPCLIQW